MSAVTEAGVDHLSDAGFAHLPGPFAGLQEARPAAHAIAGRADARSPLRVGMPPLIAVGEYLIPPEGAPARDFQILHHDFGVPVESSTPQDVARYTALHVPSDLPPTTARTRIVHLAALLGQREWPSSGGLMERLVNYGAARGARDGSVTYFEGILARLVEAVGEARPTLPSASDCLCGQELESLAAERAHFAFHDLRLEEAEVEIVLGPGELLVLDNLATAHGRLGRRRRTSCISSCWATGS